MAKQLFAAAFILSAFFVNAQTDTMRVNQLDEVIVTANKYPQKQSNTGKVISVITKDHIEKNIGRTLPQLLNEQAGITINGALSNLGANQTVYMRGAGSGRTLILLDGIPVNDPTLITNDFDINLFNLNNIERIEIARGAQSTLYGSDAVAGVINIITVKSDITKPVNVKATISGGTYSTFRGNAQVFGKLSNLTYNARYSKITSKGFSAAYDSTGTKGFDKDGYNADVANVSLQYQLSNELILKTFVQNSNYKTDLDNTVFTDEKDYTAKNKSVITGAGFHYQKNNASVTGNYQYSENKRNYFNDSADKASFTTFSTDDYIGKSHFAELYSSIILSKNFTLLHGGDFRYNRMNSSFYSLSSYGPYETAFKDTSLSQSSLYASLFYHDAKENLNIELGGRLNVHSRYGSNQTFTFNPSYKVNKTLRVFASAATGFKAPTLFQLYSAYGNQVLKPERSTTYEAGLQYQTQKVNGRAVYFNRNTKDGIDFDNLNFKYINYIKQTVNGAEFELKAELVNKLTVTFNYTFINPTEHSQSRLTFKDTAYNYLLRRPKHSFNFSAGYQLKGFYISAAAKYSGNTFDSNYGTDDVLLKHYLLLSAYAEYNTKDFIRFFVNAENITGKRFFEVRGYNSIPFLLNGGINLRF